MTRIQWTKANATTDVGVENDQVTITDRGAHLAGGQLIASVSVDEALELAERHVDLARALRRAAIEAQKIIDARRGAARINGQGEDGN